MGRYSDILLDHSRYPRNAVAMQHPDAVGMASQHGQAPYVVIFLRIRDSAIVDASFQAIGCGITNACCSILTQIVIGRALKECRDLNSQAIINALGGLPATKHFCAELALCSLKNAIEAYSTQGHHQANGSVT